MEDFLNVNEIEISIECLEEYESPHDSFSECLTKEEINDLWESSESNPWKWCCVKVTASYTDPTGRTYSEDEYLGCCNYDSKEDFINNSGYFEDMKKEAIESLCKLLRS
jgi:hypothetical protein